MCNGPLTHLSPGYKIFLVLSGQCVKTSYSQEGSHSFRSRTREPLDSFNLILQVQCWAFVLCAILQSGGRGYVFLQGWNSLCFGAGPLYWFQQLVIHTHTGLQSCSLQFMTDYYPLCTLNVVLQTYCYPILGLLVYSDFDPCPFKLTTLLKSVSTCQVFKITVP